MLKNNIKCWRIVICAKRTMNIPIKNDHRFGFGPLRLLWLLLCFIGISTSALRAQAIVDIEVLSPKDIDLTKICGFVQSGLRLYVKNATDTCIWTIPGNISKVYEAEKNYGNTLGDTLQLWFESKPTNGTIKVQVGRDGDIKAVGTLDMTFVPPADPVKNLKIGVPICQGVPTSMSVDVDPNYATKYVPGKLSLMWSHLRAGARQPENEYVEIKTDADFTHSYNYPSELFNGGTVKVTPYTCEPSVTGANMATSPVSATLKPFIVRGLYTAKHSEEAKKITQRAYTEPPPDQEGVDPWQDSLSSEANKICRYYGDIWNSLYRVSDPKKGPGKGDGFVYLQFGTYYDFEKLKNNGVVPDTIPEYYYSYEWTFNAKELAFADQQMTLHASSGFGRQKSRVILKVLEGEAVNNGKYEVKIKVTCDSCIKRGGLVEDFTYETSRIFTREDSVFDFADPDHPEHQVKYHLEAQGTVCAGQEFEIKVVYEDDASETNFSQTNATRYTFTMPEGWQEIPTEKLNPYKFRTKPTSWDGTIGTWVQIKVKPTNVCFKNYGDVTKNGDTLSVFVRNQPIKPTLYDPVGGRAITGQFTDSRWEEYKQIRQLMVETQDEHIKPRRVLACNYTSWQTDEWVAANQTFGVYIKGDSIRRDDDAAWVVVDMDRKGMGVDFNAELADPNTTPKDSTTLLVQIKPRSRNLFKDSTIRLGIYGRNECSNNGLTGDTGIFFVRIIDTLPVRNAIVSYTHSNISWDTLCEGTQIDFTSEQMYVTLGSQRERDTSSLVETDVITYEWDMPKSWKYSSVSNKQSVRPTMTVGDSSGSVKLRFINRCGSSSYREAPVVVHPYVRVTILGDTNPCQGDVVTYRFKRAKNAEEYLIKFPDGWRASSHVNPTDTRQAIVADSTLLGDWVEVSAVAVPNHDDRAGWANGVKFPVVVVGSKNKVPGVAGGCNFTLSNPKHSDTLKVKIRPHPKKPIIDGIFPLLSSSYDTVCANNIYTFQVKDTAKDDIGFVRFSWVLPNDQWVRSGNSKIYDTITFTTPDTGHVRTKIKVVANRNDCAGNNRETGTPHTSDTLEIPLLLMKALSVTVQPGQSPFVDIRKLREDGVPRPLNTMPCEGDTVYYIIKRRQDPSAYYAQFDWRPLGGTDTEKTPFDEVDRTSLTASGWKVLSKAPYHDTLKMVVGRAPIRLRAANVSYCDTSAYKEDTIRPVSKVITPGQIKARRPDANLCEYEAVSFTFDTAQYATYYIFHYPWGKKTDTLQISARAADLAAGRFTNGSYKMSFPDTLSYQAGVVYVEAWNSCGARPQNDTLKIASVLRRQGAPKLKQTDFEDFAYNAAHIVGTDSVSDTLCLRHPMVLEAAPANAALAASSGWQFHYAWGQTQTDAAVTKFEKYTSAAWSNADANSSDSLWTITKGVSPNTTTYLWLSSRHKTCERYGDSLIIVLRNVDTTALKEGDRIRNYLYDKETEKKIQPALCAKSGSADVAYYLDLNSLDITGESYYFRWRTNSTQNFSNLYNSADKTIAGSGFILKNVPDDSDNDGEPDWNTLDTLRMKIPAEIDSLEIQVVVKNRCDEAHLPGLKIRTSTAMGDEDSYIVKQESDYICNKEKLTYKVYSLIRNGDKTDTLGGIEKAGLYKWYTPWQDAVEVDTCVFTFDTAYKPGMVYVVPTNGCGDGHRSDSVVVKSPDILQPPSRVQPFAALPGYNPADGLVEMVADSACLRTDHTMIVKASLQQSEVQAENQPQNTLIYQWAMSKGKRSALKTTKTDSSEVVLNIPDFADSLYILHVASRRSVCQRYGDSLRIEVFPMDTLRFMASAVEDTVPYDRFAVLTRGVIQDVYPTPPLDSILLTPCVASAVTYSIKSNFHWSLVPPDVYTSSFSWNGGKTGTTPAGMLEGTTGWHCSDVSKLPSVIPVDKVGAAGDVFSLSVHAQNVCGKSTSGPLNLRPQPLINPDDKPTFKSLSAVCENDTVWVEVNQVANATHYVWTAKFPKGTQKDTTALPKVGYAHYDAPDATVSVHAMNACGTSLESEVWDITPLLRIPSRPEAAWFPGLPMRGDTVFDTLCINGNNLLKVKSTFADEAANVGVYYNWQPLPKSADAADFQTLGNGSDSIYLKPNPLEIAQGGHIQLMVAARRDSCPNYWSDTLYIDITMIDLVPISTLGRLIWYDPAATALTPTTPQMPFCPGAVVRIGVENQSAAPAYHWTFPDNTWRFADGFTDTTNSVVDVKVGHHAGRIYVAPMTDTDNRRCQYNSDTTSALSSDIVTLKETVEKRKFVEAQITGGGSFKKEPCAGTKIAYAIQGPDDKDLTMGLKSYRWVFPSGWKVYKDEYETIPSGENKYTFDYKETRCWVLPSADSGEVWVYAIAVCDESDGSLSESDPVKAKVTPIDTARLEVIADKTVCKDSTLTMEVKALNSLTYATAYDLSVRYFGGSDAAVITNPSNPLEISFPNAPDSTLLEVDWYSGDSVNIVFTPRNVRECPNNVQPVVYALRADTVPDIKGTIFGATRVCMEALEVFEAQATNMDTAIAKVYYRWEVPSEGGWEIVKGADSAVALIRIGAYEDAELKQTIRCYPRALCGTGAPFEYELTLNPPDDFNGSISAAYANADGTDGTALQPTDRPCIGTDLNFALTHSDKPADATIKYVWETPLGWTRLPVGAPADSTEKAAFSALRAGADTMRVRFLNLSDPQSCGLSRALQYPLFIRDFAPRARLTRPPYPCESRTEIDFVLVPDEEIDEATWTAPANDPDAEANYTPTPITDEGSRIIHNHLNLKKSDNSAFGLQRFYISIRTTNVCGWRDTLIQVRPVSPISALSSDSLHVSHYCVGDSAYAYAGIPSEYNGQGVEYRWAWEPDTALVRLLDSIVYKDDIPGGDEKVVWMRFTDVFDTATVRFYTGNDCVGDGLPPVSIRTAPYTYLIEAKAGADTALYAQEGISLSVVSTQFGSPADYTYLWQPKYRVKKQVSESGDTTYATKGLYMRREYFNVTSTELVDTAQPFYARPSACQSHDTVMIFVDSTFTVISSPIDTACVDAPYTLSVYPYGGNTDSYRFDWYRWVDSTYTPIPDAGNASSLTLETVDTALIRFMVIGRDTKVVISEDSTYQYRYNPDNNEIIDSVLVPIIHTFSQIDTQYIELRSFTVGGRIITPGKESIEVPLGTMVHFSAEAGGGSGQYRYRWETNPAGKMDSPDSTLSQAVTRRIYDNCEVLLTIYDTLTGCSTLLKVNIDLNDDLGGIPNTFTPNGDGKNDVFMPGTDLIIFNRFGEEIYRTSEAQEGWDGTHKGKVVADGDYLFVLTMKRNDREYTKRGTVTVITTPIR